MCIRDSFATAQSRSRVLDLKRDVMAAETLTRKVDIEAKLKETAAVGYARTRNSREDGVASISMPFFFDSEDPAGAISIALPDTRLTDARCAELVVMLKQAVMRLERALTGLEH